MIGDREELLPAGAITGELGRAKQVWTVFRSERLVVGSRFECKVSTRFAFGYE